MGDNKGRTGRPSIRPKVAEAWLARPDMNVSLDVIAKAAGVTREQAQNATTALAREGGLHIVTVVRGSVYRYSPGGTTTGPESDRSGIFIRLGTAASGAAVLEDQNGDLWKAERI